MYLLKALDEITSHPTLSNQAIPNQGPCGVQQGYYRLGMNPVPGNAYTHHSTPHKLSHVRCHYLLSEHGHAEHADVSQVCSGTVQAAHWQENCLTASDTVAHELTLNLKQYWALQSMQVFVCDTCCSTQCTDSRQRGVHGHVGVEPKLKALIMQPAQEATHAWAQLHPDPALLKPEQGVMVRGHIGLEAQHLVQHGLAPLLHYAGEGFYVSASLTQVHHRNRLPIPALSQAVREQRKTFGNMQQHEYTIIGMHASMIE